MTIGSLGRRVKNFIQSFVTRRELWLLPLMGWATVVAWSYHEHSEDIAQQNLTTALEGARNMFRMVMLTRQWNAEHGGVYVEVSPRTPPNPHLKVPHRDVTTTDGRRLTLVNPAYMTRQIAEIAHKDNGVTFHITSLRPIRPANAPDYWEQNALRAFEEGKKEAQAILPDTSGQLFRYMAPLLVSEACMPCHRSQGYRVGDVRGGISVSIPFAAFAAASDGLRLQTRISHFSAFALLAAISCSLLELLRRRWRQLDDKIAELETTRNELLQNEKMASLGRMVAGFAHEINTPVGVAVGAVSHNDHTLDTIEHLLEGEDVSEQALRNHLAELRASGALAQRNLRRAATLVQSFKRSAVDQSSEQQRRFDLHQTIDDVLQSLHNELKRKPIAVEVRCASRLMLDGIPGLIEQVLTNLVVNSIQHGFADGTRPGTITITVTVDPAEHLHLCYEDDGTGMDETARARVFEPFFTTRRGQGGSGLGLFICYTIVTARLGGTIHCTSAMGQGCRFDIVFPITRAHTNATWETA